MSNPVEKMTIKNLADELGISKKVLLQSFKSTIK